MSAVFQLELDRHYPVVVRGEGAWVEDSTGKRYLDAMSGGSMAATLGHGRRDVIAAASAQASRLSYVHNERLTNPPREQGVLARPHVMSANLAKTANQMPWPSWQSWQSSWSPPGGVRDERGRATDAPAN